MLSTTLAGAAEATFGASVVDSFGMTEILPVSGRVCDHRHLHHDLNMGFVEVIDLRSGSPAAPGQLGTVVVTPYYPYRECMPVFRYDTRDVVRRLAEEPLGCELAGVPATSLILGKADHLLRAETGVMTMRDLVEVIESQPGQPWPARFAATVRDGRVRLRLADFPGPFGPGDLQHRFSAAGFDVEVSAAVGVPPHSLRPLRADLVETTFSGARS